MLNIIFLTFAIGFLIGQMPRIYRMGKAINKTGVLIETEWNSEQALIIRGRLDVIKELNKLI